MPLARPYGLPALGLRDVVYAIAASVKTIATLGKTIAALGKTDAAPGGRWAMGGVTAWMGTTMGCGRRGVG